MSLPKKAKIGDKKSKVVVVRGVKRKLTWEKTRPRGKNRNLRWKIIKNEKI
jgi:hypothetical protein